MLKRTHQAIASVSTPVLVGNASRRKVEAQIVTALHSCPECETVAIVNRYDAPCCPSCSATMMTKASEADSLTLKADEVKSLPVAGTCKTCDTTFRGTEELIASLQGRQFHCTVCSSLVTAETLPDMGEGEEDEPIAEDEVMEEDMGEDMEDEVEDDLVPLSDAAGLDGEGDEELEDESDESEESLEDADPVDELPAEEEGDEEIADDLSEDENTSEGEEGDPTAEEDESMNTMASIKVQALARALKNPDTTYDLVMTTAGAETKWFLFANDAAVAISKYSRASEAVQPIYASEAFSQAFAAAMEDSATADGVVDTKVLDNFGFEPVTVDVPVEEAQKQAVDDAVAEAVAAVKNDIGTARDHFERCIGIAAAGINKGVWSDSEHTLRTALIASLQKNRVRDAERLVDETLAKDESSFLKAIVAKAIELTRKPNAVLDEVAAMVADAKPRFTSVASTDDGAPSRVVPFMSKEQPEPTPTIAAADEGAPRGTVNVNMKDLVRSIGRR